MPFYKTAYGSHYHMTMGCHGAAIPCDAAGLAPCSDCCSDGRQGTEAGGTALEPTDGPAVFTGSLVGTEDESAYAVRIMTDRATGTELVTSKGTPIGTIAADAATARHMRLVELLDATSSPAIAQEFRHAPLPDLGGMDASRSLYFDMDGTIADLYSVPDWLPKLRAFDSSPYEDATPIVDMGELGEYVTRLQSRGWRVGVVSWLSKVPTPEYDRAVSTSKYLWLMRNLPMLDEINFVSYGVAKHHAVAARRNAVLVDDEEQNLSSWYDESSNRTTINARDSHRMMAALRNLALGA